MKIAVISANGRSGTAFVQAVLKAGHQVRAGVFGQHNFALNDNLEIVQCDATSVEDVYKLIKDQDVIVSLIGHTKRTPKNIQTNAIKNVVAAVGDSGIKVISLTGTGVRFPGDKPSLMDKFLNFGIANVDPARVEDGINHAEVLKNSNTNWTLVRVLKLINGQPKDFSLSLSGPAKLLTSRSEVAQAILQVIQSDEYSKKVVIISSKN